MSTSPHVIDVNDADFTEAVLRRSNDVPVIVDFWAEWCGPCKTLGPMLEEAVDAAGGAVVLAKVDVDANPGLSQAFKVQGIPAVKAFRDGKIVAEFTGALPVGQVREFVAGVLPTEADRLAKQGETLAPGDPEAARPLFEAALELDDRHAVASIWLAEILASSDPKRARALATPHRPLPRVEELLARLDLAELGGADLDALRGRVDADPTDGDARLDLGQALAAEGAYEDAFTQLLAAVKSGGDARELAREQVVQLFTVLGHDHELTKKVRPRLAAALY